MEEEGLTHQIIGAAMEVHRQLGCGLEAVYHEAFLLELTARGIPFVSQQEITIVYKGRQLKHKYKADLIIDGKVLVYQLRRSITKRVVFQTARGQSA